MPSLLTLLGITAMAAVVALALIKGAAPERLGSVLIASVWLLSALVWRVAFAVDAKDFKDFRLVAGLVADAVVSFGFLVLAIRYSSWWLGAAMLAESYEFSLIAHYLFNPEAFSNARAINAYIFRCNIVSFGILAILIGGTLASWRGKVVARRREASKAAKRRGAEVVPSLPAWPPRLPPRRPLTCLRPGPERAMSGRRMCR